MAVLTVGFAALPFYYYFELTETTKKYQFLSIMSISSNRTSYSKNFVERYCFFKVWTKPEKSSSVRGKEENIITYVVV
jgi:hypothetical protein